MRVLVTGATGLIGRSLLARLAPGIEVIGMARGEPPPGPAGVDWVRQDLTEPLDGKALPHSLDAIVHLAQSERYRDFPDGAEDVFEVNVHSTFRLLDYARRAGADRFVLASTGGVYGPAPDPIREDAPLVLAGPYFRSKRMAELLVEDHSELLRAITLRFFFVYGPGQGRTLVPRLSERILTGEEIVIEGDPGMRMNPIYVEDAAAGVEAALRIGESAVVNVAGDETLDVTELVQRLGTALGREPTVTHAAGRDAEADMVADTARMRELLGVVPTTPLDRGLEEAARSFAAIRSGSA
jgi:UDP-glucose 4-epimerase